MQDVPEGLITPVKTHALLLDGLRDRTDGRVVTAVTNSTKGNIDYAYGKVQRGYNIGRIIGRVDLDIVLPAYGLPGARLEDITHFHTQDHAMEQCHKTLAELNENAFWVSETDTALSALSVLALNDRTHAAITPHAAGQAAGLACLAENLRDNKERNITSFYMLGKGVYDILPKGDSAITVAALDRIGDEQSGYIHEACKDLGGISLINPDDINAKRLIVEMNFGGDHEGAVSLARSDLRGAYDVRLLGGYDPVMTMPAVPSLVAAR